MSNYEKARDYLNAYIMFPDFQDGVRFVKRASQIYVCLESFPPYQPHASRARVAWPHTLTHQLIEVFTDVPAVC